MTAASTARSFRPRFRAVAGAVVLALAGATLVQASGAIADPAALSCDQNTAYGIDGNGAMKRIDLTTGDVTDVATASVGGTTAGNALGVARNGAAAYAVSQATGNAILRIDPDGTTTEVGAAPTATTTGHVIRGAVDPANGLFYTATDESPSVLGAFDPSTGQSIEVGVINGLSVTNGDIAFSASGALFVLAGAEIRRVVGDVPTAAGSAPIETAKLASLQATSRSPGIAFSDNGYLYVSVNRGGNAPGLIKVDAATGTTVGNTLPLQPASGSYTPFDLASCNYSNTIAATSSLGAQAAAGDAFSVEIMGSSSSGNTATTGPDGQTASAGPVPALPGRTYSVRQTPVGGTKQADYTTTWSCTWRQGMAGQQHDLGSDTGDTASFTFPTLDQTNPDGIDVACAFTNTPKTAPLRIVSRLDGARVDDADQFTVGVQRGGSTLPDSGADTTTGAGTTVTAGTGDTGALPVIVDRAYDLTQVLAGGSRSASGQYVRSISCVDSGTGGTVLPATGAFTGSVSITPQPGASVVCTITASPAPASVALSTVLGDDRAAPADQFTAAIDDGASQHLGTPATATTTGSGDQVDPGTGATALDPAVGGTAVRLVQSSTGDDRRYTRVLTCTDANHYQDASTTAFTGSASITPVAGAKLACTVQVTLAGAGLRVDTALSDPRFDDGDQFTAAIHRGPDASGSVANSTADATTQGTGRDVTAGSGTTGTTTLAHGSVVTITDDAGRDAVRYARSLTCVDMLGDPSLPTNQAFTGSYTLTMQPGAAVRCTVTASAAPASVVISAGLGSDRFDAADQFAVGLRDGGGQDLGTAATERSTGSGDTVDPGTGTTGQVVAPRGTAYTITGAPTADPARYDSSISCTEGSGLTAQPLPSGAFTGTASVVPQAGAVIACVVRSALKAAALTATAALGSARFDDGDQWTPAWYLGDPTGAPLNDTAHATTAGTGDRITAGTGTTGAVVAANAVAYTLADAVTADAARYATTLTCEDANGLQQGLPDGAAFTGPTRVVPQAGADVHCVLRAAVAPAALTLHLSGPASAQVGATTAWTAQLTNTGGASAVGAVAAQLPEGLTYRDVQGDGWSCTASGRVLTCAGPAIRGGSGSTATIDLVPAAGSEGDAVLRAAVDPTGAGAPVDPASCSGSGLPTAGCDVARAVVGGLPRLTVSITPPASAAVGAPATWQVTARDQGTAPAGGVTVRLQLPDGIGTPIYSGADCTVSGREATCVLPGSLATGAARSFTLTAVPQPSAAGGQAVLRAAVDPSAGTPGDPAACTADDPAAGCAVSLTPVASGIALVVTVVPPAQLTEGVPAPYQVVVTDTGTAAAAAPSVSVHLPDGLQVVGTAGATCTGTGGDLVCLLPAGLPAGGSSSFTVTVQPVVGAAGTALAPAAAVDPAGGAPGAASGCTATGSPAGCAVSPPRTVQPAGRTLRITGRVTGAPSAGLVAGDRIRYAFTVTNTSGRAVDRLDLEVAGLGAAHCASSSLAAGASTTCTLGPVTVTQEQVDAGTVARDAVATAVPAGCTTSCPSVRSNTVTPAAPVRTVIRLKAVQTAHLHDRNGDGVAQVGERVDFAVRVTNTGTVTLRDLRLRDGLVSLTCPVAVLAVGDSTTCTGSRITTGADAAVGGMRSDAVATAQGARANTTVSERTTVSVAAAGRTTGLAHTGSNLTAGLAAGGVLLVLGGVLLVLGRRRRRTA